MTDPMPEPEPFDEDAPVAEPEEPGTETPGDVPPEEA